MEGLQNTIKTEGNSFLFFVWKTGADWRSLGTSLGIDSKTLDGIDEQYRRSDQRAAAVIRLAVELRQTSYRSLLYAMQNMHLREQLEMRPRLITELDTDQTLLERLRNDYRLLGEMCGNPNKSYTVQQQQQQQQPMRQAQPPPIQTPPNPLAAALQAQEQMQTAQTMGKMVHSSNAHFITVMGVMNAKRLWHQWLGQRGLLHTPAMEQYVETLGRKWEASLHSSNPTQELWVTMCQSSPEFSQMPITDFAQELRRLNDQELTAAVADWISFFQTQNAAVARKNQASTTVQSALRTLLVEKLNFPPEDVDGHIARLKGLGVEIPTDLGLVKEKRFVKAGFNAVQAARLVNASKTLSL